MLLNSVLTLAFTQSLSIQRAFPLPSKHSCSNPKAQNKPHFSTDRQSRGQGARADLPSLQAAVTPSAPALHRLFPSSLHILETAGRDEVLHPDFWHTQSPEEPDLGEENPPCTWQGVDHDDFYHPFQCKPFYDSMMYFTWKKHEGLSSFPDGAAPSKGFTCWWILWHHCNNPDNYKLLSWARAYRSNWPRGFKWRLTSSLSEWIWTERKQTLSLRLC